MTNADDPNGLERVVERIRERRELGESPTAEDIEDEFPEWKGRLSSIFGVIDLLDEFGGDSARGIEVEDLLKRWRSSPASGK